MVVTLAGVDHRSGLAWLDHEPTVGGWGALAVSDGQDGMIGNVNGSLKDLSIKVAETKFPLRITQYAFRPDSGGPGKWRDGNGVVREYTINCEEAVVYLWFERSRTPAWGSSADTTRSRRENERHFLKCPNVRLERGDAIGSMTGGGGGFGNPRERDSELVRADVENGYVTREAARSVYGVEASG